MKQGAGLVILTILVFQGKGLLPESHSWPSAYLSFVCPQGEGVTYLFGALTTEGVGHFFLREYIAPSLLSHDSAGSRP